MKGIVFTEFFEFVTAVHSENMVDDIIDDAHLESGGAYTSVGTYHHTEMQSLVTALAHRTATPVPELLISFGRHLCGKFSVGFPEFFKSKTCLFDFLESVHGHIHIEVRKLYPDAELPAFRTHARDDHSMAMDYRSCRPLSALAEGLIMGASDVYAEQVTIGKAQMEEPGGNFMRFTIERV